MLIFTFLCKQITSRFYNQATRKYSHREQNIAVMGLSEITGLISQIPCKSIEDYARYLLDHYSFLMPSNPFEPCSIRQLENEIVRQCGISLQTRLDVSVLRLIPNQFIRG